MAIEGDPDNLGTDINLVSDLAPVWGLATQGTNLANAILRRLTTPRGGLFYDLNYGYDVMALLNSAMGPTELSAARGAITSEARKDPRVLSATVDLSFTRSTKTLSISIGLITAEGPFDLVLLATDVSVSVLSINGVQQATQVTTTVPAAAAAALVGPPGPAGPTGPQGPAGSGSSAPELTLDDDGIVGSDSGSEEVVYQFDAADFGALPATITAELSAAVLSESGTATFRLRVGGTDGGIDGTVRATMTATTAGYVQKNASSSFSNPGGLLFVKVTAQSSGSSVDSRIKGMVATFR